MSVIVGMKGEKTMKYYLWHNTRGKANQYFICKGTKVLFQIPKFIALIISKGEKQWTQYIERWK